MSQMNDIFRPIDRQIVRCNKGKYQLRWLRCDAATSVAAAAQLMRRLRKEREPGIDKENSTIASAAGREDRIIADCWPTYLNFWK